MDTLREECYVLIKDTLTRSDSEEKIQIVIPQISNYITGIRVQSVKIKLGNEKKSYNIGNVCWEAKKVFDVNTETDYDFIIH